MAENTKKHKKHNIVRQYFTTPVIFVLISLVAAVPLALVMLHFSVIAVHKAQNNYVAKVADYTVSAENYTPSDVKSGEVAVPELYGFSKLGDLSCDKAGLNTAVYYGNNRASFREGAGLSTDKKIPGEGGAVVVSANSTGAFRALYNVKNGDIITFVTSWGVYKYKVFDVSVGTVNPSVKEETLYLSTAASKSAFSVYDSGKYIVSAHLISGPTVKGGAK